MVKAVVVGGAAAPAVALALAKEHLAVLHTRTDVKIANNIDAAEEYLEDEFDMAISEKSYELVLGGFAPCVELLPYNATAIESVKYVDALGVTQTLDAAKYRLDIGKPGVVVFNDMPEVADGGTVTIRFKAGWAAADIPKKIQQAILMLVSTFYDNDSDVVIGRLVSTLPLTVERLMWSYRLMRVG